MVSIVNDLNPVQQEAVVFDKGPLLILAGAGSGKTRVLTYRAAWLIQEKGALSDELLCLTFTNRAAEEMKGRILKLLRGVTIPPLAGTFHSFCSRILRLDGNHIGIPPSFVIYDDQDSQDAVKMAIQKLDLPTSFKPHSILSTISGLKNELINPFAYSSLAQNPWQKKVAQVYLHYQKILEEAGAVDFDDLLNRTVELFKNHPQVLEKYQRRYSYLFVDEWQDTNYAQYHIIKMLAKKNKNLTVVGDSAQSIYSFRGANYRNLERLVQDFPQITVINLEQNYRSTQKILDAAYGVISKNTRHPILKLWTDNEKGENLTLYQATNEMDEARFVVRESERLTRKGYSLYDIAVLYRTNAQSRVIEEAFLRAGIPYAMVGGTKFYSRKEIKDILAYIRLVTNPQDSVSRNRAEKIGKNRLKRFNISLGGLINDKNTTLVILDAVLETTNYLDLYDANDKEDSARLENIKELRSVAAQFPSLTDFLENVALMEDQPGKSNNYPTKAVTLMTAHAAKGLEFEIVFIVGLEEGIFPHMRSLENEEGLEEERRLCYVGITRAKKKLYLTFCSRRMLFGQRTNNMPSRFLGDIPENLFDSSLAKTSTYSRLSWIDDLDSYYDR